MYFKKSKATIFTSAAVRHLVTNAKYYHYLVERAHVKDAILRGIFVAGANGGEVVERRAAAVSLSSLNVDFGRSLGQLYSTCNKSCQFVCWLTIENEDGDAIDHTTLIIDKFADDPIWEGEVHLPAETRGSSGSPSRGNSNSVDPRVSFLQQRMESTVASPPPSSSSRVPQRMNHSPYDSDAMPMMNGEDGEDIATMVPGGPRYDVRALGRELDNLEASAAQTKTGKFVVQSVQSGVPGVTKIGAVYDEEDLDGGRYVVADEALTQRLNDMMSVSLLTSKAATKLIHRVDEAHTRLDRLIDISEPMTSGPTPQEVLDKILSTLNSMELRMRLMEEHIASMELERDRLRDINKEGWHDQAMQANTRPEMHSTFTQTEEFDIIRPENSPQQYASGRGSGASLSLTTQNPLLKEMLRGGTSNVNAAIEDYSARSPSGGGGGGGLLTSQSRSPPHRQSPHPAPPSIQQPTHGDHAVITPAEVARQLYGQGPPMTSSLPPAHHAAHQQQTPASVPTSNHQQQAIDPEDVRMAQLFRQFLQQQQQGLQPVAQSVAPPVAASTANSAVAPHQAEQLRRQQEELLRYVAKQQEVAEQQPQHQAQYPAATEQHQQQQQPLQGHPIAAVSGAAPALHHDPTPTNGATPSKPPPLLHPGSSNSKKTVSAAAAASGSPPAIQHPPRSSPSPSRPSASPPKLAEQPLGAYMNGGGGSPPSTTTTIYSVGSVPHGVSGGHASPPLARR